LLDGSGAESTRGAPSCAPAVDPPPCIGQTSTFRRRANIGLNPGDERPIRSYEAGMADAEEYQPTFHGGTN
jgi:hypothetical protein